ncbi:MAG: T9SS type A sorting domain-containing protein [Saprospiraceae bacterium]
MKNQLLPLLLLFGHATLFAQTKLVGFSESGEINAMNSGGMVWEMEPDGSGFSVLKNFEAQKPIRPLGQMVVGPDGKGYGIAKGFDFDANAQVFYQYDFENKMLDVIRVFKDSLWDSPLIIGTDALLYGCRRVSPTAEGLYKMSLDGKVLTLVHEFVCSSYTNGILQTLDGKIVVTYVDWPVGVTIISGSPDGSDWQNLSVFDGAAFGYETSNLVQKSNGVLYGAIWQYYGTLRFFQILPDAQTFSVMYETTVPAFGRNISMNWGMNEVLYAVAEKNWGQAVYQVPTDGTPPIEMFYDNAHGSQRTALAKSVDGDLYFLTTKAQSGVQYAYLFKIKGDNSAIQIIATTSFSVPVNTNQIMPILAHPTNDRLYFWRVDDYKKLSVLTTCKADGTNLTTDYSTEMAMPNSAGNPKKLIHASDGKYYGFLTKGGANNTGYIFKMNPNGSAFQPICQLPPAQQPTVWTAQQMFSFFEGSDGWLYGAVGDGKIFKVNKNGSGFVYILSDFCAQCNFIERPDGMLYWGGSKLMRMDKDGSNISVVADAFIHPFTNSDFCEIYALPNGNIGGAGSYTYDDNHDLYTTPIVFSYNLLNGIFQTLTDYPLRPSSIAMGNDGALYFGKGKFDPENMVISAYDVQCPYLSGGLSQNQIADAALQGSNGEIFGQRHIRSTTNGQWLPMAWSAENGVCEMSVDWNPSIGYKGRFAFEVDTFFISTVQPQLSEGILIAPNPTRSSTQIFAQLNAPDSAIIFVSDMLGRVVFEQKTKMKAGENIFEIPACALSAKGLYQVSLKTGQGVSSQMLSVY